MNVKKIIQLNFKQKLYK